MTSIFINLTVNFPGELCTITDKEVVAIAIIVLLCAIVILVIFYGGISKIGIYPFWNDKIQFTCLKNDG